MTKSEQSTGLGVVGVADEQVQAYKAAHGQYFDAVMKGIIVCHGDVSFEATRAGLAAVSAPSMTPTTHPATCQRDTKRYDEHPDGGGMREDVLGAYVKYDAALVTPTDAGKVEGESEARDTVIALEILDAVMKWMIKRGAIDIDTEYQPSEIVALLDDLIEGPAPEASPAPVEQEGE